MVMITIMLMMMVMADDRDDGRCMIMAIMTMLTTAKVLLRQLVLLECHDGDDGGDGDDANDGDGGDDGENWNDENYGRG